MLVRIDVSLIDDKVLDTLREHAGADGLCDLSLKQLSNLVRCHLNTAYRSVNSLEAAGRIRIYRKRGLIHKYEVIDA
ncbi:hypothetical protein FBR02_03415 [Anaerolineae bacterium CFX9]|nr:hypothetical protein [Anaerolineae bacterium CFX9]